MDAICYELCEERKLKTSKGERCRTKPSIYRLRNTILRDGEEGKEANLGTVLYFMFS